MLHQLTSLVGALMILGAYAALQAGRLDRTSRTFCLLNFFGSGILTWAAIVDRNYGFILLEGSWALLSLVPLVRPGRPSAS
jgi:hypothetical protein